MCGFPMRWGENMKRKGAPLLERSFYSLHRPIFLDSPKAFDYERVTGTSVKRVRSAFPQTQAL